MEASEDIPVGTTLLRESPITWALHPERFGSHCQECLGQVKSGGFDCYEDEPRPKNGQIQLQKVSKGSSKP